MSKYLKIFYYLFLLPVSLIWENIYRIRRFLYNYEIISKQSFRVPIISVGNITFGGSGKTPFIIWLVEFFSKLNINTVVLTRGYKGELEKSSGVIRENDQFKLDAVRFGDEPVLIAKKIKKGAVIVGQKRCDNLKQHFNYIRPEVVLLDDGFQHLKLNRNLDIVLFDASENLNRYKVAPCGYLREGLSALKDADIICISNANYGSDEKLNDLQSFIQKNTKDDILICQTRYVPTGIYNGHYKKIHSIQNLSGMRVIAVGALASPRSFFNLLEQCGAQIVDKVIFPDHYYYKAFDLEELLLKSKKLNAIVLTTEKDIVKIKKVVLSENILFLGIRMEFISGEGKFKYHLSKTVKRTII